MMTSGSRYLENTFGGEQKRVRRYDTTLFLLDWTAEKRLEELTRIQVQKAVYLTQVIAPLYRMLEDIVRYRSYNFGPYSVDIQNAVDHLVGLGYADVTFFEASSSGTKSCYRITSSGRYAAEQLRTHPVLQRISNATQTVVNLINIYGLDNIVGIVYQEPTFKSIRKTGARGMTIPIGYNEENRTLESIQYLMDLAENRFSYKNISVDAILVTFFEYLYENYRSERE